MTGPTLEIARSIYRVEIARIDPEGGLRPLDQAWVVALAGLMKDGQEEPIEIYPKGDRFGMTAGRHRLAVAQLLGWTHIDADIKPAEERRREISENLFKLGLSPLDRAAFVASLISIERAKAGVAAGASPQSVAATARWSDRIGAEADDASAIVAHAFGFADEAAEKVGLSRRAIYRDLELHRGIRPDVVAAVRTLPVADNATQLRALARLPEGQQRAVAELLTAGTAKGVTDALATMSQKPLPDAGQKAWNAFISSWGRMGRPMQRLALVEILGQSSTAPALKALLKHLEHVDAPALDMVLGHAGGELLEQPGSIHGPAVGGSGADEGVRPSPNGSRPGAASRVDRERQSVADAAELTLQADTAFAGGGRA